MNMDEKNTTEYYDVEEEYTENGEYAEITPMWDYLAECRIPIVMYGMGEGAVKIMRVMERHGIKPHEFMASDDFVRGHEFLGYKVRKLSELEEMYDDFAVIICFGTALPEVMQRIYAIAERHPVFVPDVSVIGDSLFDEEYVSENEYRLMTVRSMLADSRSKEVFDSWLKFRLSGSLEHLRMMEDSREAALSLLGIGKKEIFVDLGAYNGDTVEEFLIHSDRQFEKIYAFEPDERNFGRLKRRHYALPQDKFIPLHAAAWNCDDTLTFYRKAGRNSSLADNISEKTKGREIKIPARSVDSVLGGEKATIIKFDVEGSEKEALLGCEKTIKKYHPRLIVSMYHRNEDLIELPLLISKLAPGYKFYLRHQPCFPAWDTELYCIY